MSFSAEFSETEQAQMLADLGEPIRVHYADWPQPKPADAVVDEETQDAGEDYAQVTVEAVMVEVLRSSLPDVSVRKLKSGVQLELVEREYTVHINDLQNLGAGAVRLVCQR